jgi:lipopolysaccharide export system permease protein
VRATNASGAPKERVVGREFRSGYWLRDGANFVNIASLQANGGLERIRVYTFDESNRLQQIIDAASASNTVQDGVSQWQLENVKRTLFLASDQVKVESLASMPWQVNFGRGLLQTLQTAPEDMSFDQLQNYIEHLKKNNQQSARYESALLSKLAYPVACIVMMLLALPFAITSSRKGGAGIKILAGIIIGLTFHALGSLFGYASQRGLWPAWVGAFAPTIIFATAVFASLRWLERR